MIIFRTFELLGLADNQDFFSSVFFGNMYSYGQSVTVDLLCCCYCCCLYLLAIQFLNLWRPRKKIRVPDGI